MLISSFDEGAPWLHDRLAFHFDEPVDYASWVEHARVRLANGGSVPVSHNYARDQLEWVFIEVDPSVMVGGSLFVELDGVVDAAGNPLEPTTLSWPLGEWTVDERGLDLGGDPGPPSIAVMDHPWNDSSTPVAAVWTVGPEEARLVTGVYRHGAWQPMGEDAAGDTVTVDTAAYLDTLHVVGPGQSWEWSSAWDLGFDPGSQTRVASSPGRWTVASASRYSDRVEVYFHRNWAYDPVPIDLVSVAGGPTAVEIALPIEDAPVVAVTERRPSDQLLHVAAFLEGSWQGWGALAIPDAHDSLSLVSDGDDAYVAWAEPLGPRGLHRTHVGRASPAGLEEIVAPIAASPSPIKLEIDADGSVIAVWVEPANAAFTGRIARWDGEAWQDLAAPWAQDGGTIGVPAVALWNGRVPVVSWRQGDEIRIALYNGPVAP